jgi:hypothetical protein
MQKLIDLGLGLSKLGDLQEDKMECWIELVLEITLLSLTKFWQGTCNVFCVGLLVEKLQCQP